MKKLKEIIWEIIYSVLGNMSPRTLVSLHYRRAFGHKLDWKNPKDINEKINWLKFYGDTSRWTDLADKYRVREYIEQCGLGDMLVPLYGKWDKAEDIDWSSLPDKFVMKTNHGSGDVLICEDKSKLDTDYWTKTFAKLLKEKFGTQMGEPHYDKMKPCIIAEKLLDKSKQQGQSSSIIDYKIWTFNGQPAYILVCYNRRRFSLDLGIYDTNWINHFEFGVSNGHYSYPTSSLPCPITLDKMLQSASILGKGFPVVRVDMYEINGQLYFGELTFTPAAGFIDYHTQEFLNILGAKCILPKLNL